MVDCRNKALELLSRREHSCNELQLKLTKRGYGLDEIQNVLQALIEAGLQSDARFSQSYVRLRASKGFGPSRIRQELHLRQISDELIENSLFAQEIDWIAQARMAKCKKFGRELSEEFAEKIKQMKFLQYRGFESVQIHDCLEQC